VVTEIDTKGKLVELKNGLISSANDDEGCQTIKSNGKHKESMRSQECSVEKSTLEERETPFLTKVRLYEGAFFLVDD